MIATVIYHETRRNALITSWDEEECNNYDSHCYIMKRGGMHYILTSWNEEE